MSGDYADRIDGLAGRAAEERDAFDPPADPPAEDRAMAYLREGFGPAVWLYVEARTGGRSVRFEPDGFARLEDAANTWLELYAACYGTPVEADVSLRTAAELLVETRNVRDTAQLLTHVPSRRNHHKR